MGKKDKCLCPGCPSFVECKQLAFCFIGKSKCIKNKRGCLCMGCPVQIENGFKHDYYCLRSSEKELGK